VRLREKETESAADIAGSTGDEDAWFHRFLPFPLGWLLAAFPCPDRDASPHDGNDLLPTLVVDTGRDHPDRLCLRRLLRAPRPLPLRNAGVGQGGNPAAVREGNRGTYRDRDRGK